MTTSQPVVAITGGSMGLGLALTQALLGKGFAVAICARDEDRLKRSVHTLSQHGHVIGYGGDVADPSFQGQFIEHILRDFGQLDAWVNNASILGDVPMPSLMHTSIENLRHVFEANTFAPIALLQHALPHLVKQPRSLAISLSSDAAIGGYPGWGVYGASKASLDLLHKTCAAEQADNTTVWYAVDPSDMDTAMHHAASPGDEGLNQPDVVAATIAPLFDYLRNADEPLYPSGTRLQVQGRNLVTREVC